MNFQILMLKVWVLDSIQLIIWLPWTLTELMAGLNHKFVHFRNLKFIPSIPHYIMLSNALKEWKPIKIYKEKSECLDLNATWKGLNNLPKESLFQILMEINSSKSLNNTLELKQDGFHLSVNSVFTWDPFIFQWKTL